MNSRLPKSIFAALAAYALAYFYLSYARLPEVLASHFNARGQPNGWETKPVFFAVFAGTMLIAALISIGGPSSPICRTNSNGLVRHFVKPLWNI